jgi:hypothetical protein
MVRKTFNVLFYFILILGLESGIWKCSFLIVVLKTSALVTDREPNTQYPDPKEEWAETNTLTLSKLLRLRKD